MKVGIAGAGIGGLAAAALLAQAGHTVTVFDRFEAPRPIGSGLVIQPVGQEALRRIGADGVFAHGRRLRRMIGHEAASGRRVLDVSWAGTPGLGIHRAALWAALWQAAEAAGARFEPGCTVLAAEDGRFVMEGGRSHRFDLLVDAAGAGSPLSRMKAVPLPFGALWANVPWPEGAALRTDELTQRYRRANRMAGILPIGTLPGGGPELAALFWSLPESGYEGWRAAGMEAWTAEMVALFPEIAPFAAALDGPEALVFARYSHGRLSRPHRPGLAHIGDAAHRTSPQLGQGANMALLDALALAEAIRLADGQDPLALYARARAVHVWAYQTMSRAFTPQYQSESRVLPLLRDLVLAPLSRVPPVPRILSRLVAGDLVPPLASLNRR